MNLKKNNWQIKESNKYNASTFGMLKDEMIKRNIKSDN